jgi:hypothetical protein
MTYSTTAEFDRDLKKLTKRYETLPEDLETVKRSAIELCHIHNISQNVIEIRGAGNTEDLQFYKVKKFASRSFKGRGNNTGLRLIYVFFPKKMEVTLLEIYIKGDKENEDRKRIKEFSSQQIRSADRG